jgi:hypothetical protein
MNKLGYRWRGDHGVYVLHFIGAVKPWNMSLWQRLFRCLQLVRRRQPHECVAVLLHAAFVLRGRMARA